MRTLELDHKNDERMRAIQKFTLMDDTFMTQVFAGDTECTQELLHIILHRADLRVTRAVTQLTIGNLFGRSVRLDIYAVDEAGRQYDIEVQQEDKGAAPERARLNSALFDARITTAGEQYDEIPESYIIFITARDVLRSGCSKRWSAGLHDRADDTGDGKAFRRQSAYCICQWCLSWRGRSRQTNAGFQLRRLPPDTKS